MMTNRRIAGATLTELLVVLIYLIGIGGWVANIVKIVGAAGDQITGMFILRCIGIIVAPLGAVLGFL